MKSEHVTILIIAALICVTASIWMFRDVLGPWLFGKLTSAQVLRTEVIDITDYDYNGRPTMTTTITDYAVTNK